jgi:hypothetical protein
MEAKQFIILTEVDISGLIITNLRAKQRDRNRLKIREFFVENNLMEKINKEEKNNVKENKFIALSTPRNFKAVNKLTCVENLSTPRLLFLKNVDDEDSEDDDVVFLGNGFVTNPSRFKRISHN